MVCVCVCVWERERERDRPREGDKDRLLYWPITSSLEHTTLGYLQGITSSLPTWHTKPVIVRGPLDPLRLWFSICRLDTAESWHWLKTQTGCNPHMGIYIYHFVTSKHFRSTTWLLPLIFTCVFCLENLRLTAWSRVNMQQLNCLIIQVFVSTKYVYRSIYNKFVNIKLPTMIDVP